MNDKNKIKLARVKDIFAIAELIKYGEHIIKADIKVFHKEDDLIPIGRASYSILRK